MDNTPQIIYQPEIAEIEKVEAQEVKEIVKEELNNNPLVCNLCEGKGYPEGIQCLKCGGTGGI